MKFHTMPQDEVELHERTERCRCGPEITIERNADLGVTTTDIKHRPLANEKDLPSKVSGETKR